MADLTTEQLVNVIKENNRDLVSQLGATSKVGGGGFSIGGVNPLTKLTDAGLRAADALGAVATGSMNAGKALQYVAGAASVLGPAGEAAGKVIGKMGDAAIYANNSINTIGQNGARLDNNLGLLTKSVTGARMSFPELEGTIKNSGKSLSGLAYNMDQSTLVYLNTAKKIQETGLANQLQATGMSSQEFGSILTLVANNARAGDLTRESTQKLVVASAVKLATEFDNTARLTGMSIEEQRRGLEAQTKRKDVELSMMAMTEEQREAFNQNLAATQKFGQAAMDATRIISMGGPVNAEEQRIVAGLDPQMQDAIRRLTEVQGTGKEADDKRAAIKAEMDAIALRTASDKEGLRLASLQLRAGDEQTRALAETKLQTAQYGLIQQKAAIAGEREGKSREQYIKDETEKLGAYRKAAAEGRVAPESQVGTIINRGERGIKDTAAGLGVGFEKLNTETGTMIGSFKSVNNVLRPWTQEQMAKVPEKAYDAAKKATGVTKTAIPESAAKAANVPASAGVKPLERQDGSFGAVGKFIEDFGKGTPAILHGREGVITEKQFNDLFNSASNKNSNVKVTAPEKKPTPKVTKKTVVAEKKPETPTPKPTALVDAIGKQINNLLGAVGFGPKPVAAPEKKEPVKIVKQIKQQKTTTATQTKAIKQPPAFDEKLFNNLLNPQQLEQVILKQNRLNTPEEKLSKASIAPPKITSMPPMSQFGGLISGLQSNMSMEIEKNKSSMPKMEDFQSMAARMETSMSSAKEKMPEMSSITPDMSAMTDMKDQLSQLNTLMSQMLSHTASMADNTDAQVRATRSLSGNMLS